MSCIWVVPTPAHAQYFGGGLDTTGIWTPQVGSIMGSDWYDPEDYYEDGDALDYLYGDDKATQSGERAIAGAHFALDPVVLTYPVNPAVRQALYDRYFPTPVEQAMLSQSFGEADMIESLEQALSAYGLSGRNMADGLTVWMVSAESLVRGEALDLDAATLTAFRTRLAAALLSQTELATLSDAEKQEASEELLIQAFIYDSALRNRQSDPEGFAALQKIARETGQAMGVPFGELRFSDRSLQTDEAPQVSSAPAPAMETIALSEDATLDEIAAAVGLTPEALLDEWMMFTPEAERRLRAAGLWNRLQQD